MDTTQREAKFIGLPHIEPDTKLQVADWNDKEISFQEREFNAKVRRAFLQHIITEFPLGSVDEIQEVLRRRFGVAPAQNTTLSDLRDIRAIRVPGPEGRPRYRIMNQVNQVNVSDELNERIRIDTLSIARKHDTIFLETNRGTATALVQLLNLMIDDAQLPYVLGVTTDNDKWVVIHMEDGNRANVLEGKLKPKLF